MPSLVNVSVFMNYVVITELYCLYWTIKIRQTKKLRMIWNDVSHRVKKTKCSHPTSCFYSSCGELDAFETLFLIRFGKKTVGTLLRHRLQLLWSLIFAQTLSYRKQIFEIWSGNEQLPFKFETTKKVGSSGLVW